MWQPVSKSWSKRVIESAKYAREAACEIITILKESGAGVDVQNKYGMTALILAARGGHSENVACLIAQGADVNAKSYSGETALKFAELINRNDMAQLLKEHGAMQ
jgi:ankyrin repeat protein